jgi:hypothetical protein
VTKTPGPTGYGSLASPRLVFGAHGVAIILDQPEGVRRTKVQHSVDVERIPESVGNHDRFGPRAEGLGQLIRVDVVGERVDVDEYRHHSVLDDWCHRGREPCGDRDHLVARSDAAITEAR